MSAVHEQTATKREEWLQKRRKCIGGSDVAAVIGLSPYSSAYDVWAAKVHDFRKATNETATRLGTKLQRSIAELAFEDLRLEMESEEEFTRHSVYDWAGATTDYVAKDARGRRVIVECKATYQSKWSEIPVWIQTQLAWQCFTKSIDFVYVPVLHASTSFEIYEFEFIKDAPWFQDVFAACESFWRNHVLAGVPPTPTYQSEAYRHFEAVKGKAIEIDDESFGILTRIVEMKQQKKQAETAIVGLEAILKSRVIDAEELTYKGSTVATWRQSKDSTTFDLDAFKMAHPRVFRKYQKARKGNRPFLPKIKGADNEQE